MEAATGVWPHHWPFLLLIIAVPILFTMACFIKRPFIRSLKNKHVFITGGSSGIGLAIAKKVLVEGAYVTLVSRSINNLSSAADILVKEAQCSPDNIRCEAADVGDYEALASAIKRAIEWRVIDVMVCNAGLTRGGYLGDGSLQDLEVTVRTNFMGSVYALHAALPLLKRRSRTHPISIVIMASLASLFFMYGHSVYTATKYAMRGLAEGLRFELLPYNIKVSLICPGFTSTPFLDEAEKEKEICGLLKWVNLYSRRYAQSADAVAKQTVGAMKSGAFMVTTNMLGLFLATLGRGFVPADSWAKVMMEVVLFFPVRVASLVCISIFRSIVLHQSVARYYDDDSITMSPATHHLTPQSV